MRAAALFLVTATAASAQFRATAPLVVAPVTVTDPKGHYVNGLTAADLTFFDNSVPQKVQLEVESDRISLAVLVQATTSSRPVLDDLSNAGSLFSDLVAAEAGETALMTFSGEVQLAQDFTLDSTPLKAQLRKLRPQGDAAALFDGIAEAVHRLSRRDPKRRRILLVIAEQRDRGSKMQLDALLRDPALQHTTVYWLTYSKFLTSFTSKPKTVWDRMTDEQKHDPARLQGDHPFPLPNEEVWLPDDPAPGSLINIFTELAHHTKVDAASLLARTTGGRTFGFVRQKALDEAIHAVADEIHQQYIVSFTPKTEVQGTYHALRAEAKDRPEWKVRTRTGYWAVH